MARVQLTVVGMEFEEGGNAIWIHGTDGTVLRIQCTGKINITPCSTPGPHADVRVVGDINICVPGFDEIQEEDGYVH